MSGRSGRAAGSITRRTLGQEASISAFLSHLQVAAGGVQRTFCFRELSSADRGVIDQIFSQGDYDLGELRQRHPFERYWRDLVARGATPLIVDAGANIGASAVWFSLTYPKSHIVALEPERNNAALLRRNCEGLDCEVIEGGIARADGKMFLEDAGHGDWGFRLSAERGSYAVPTHAGCALVERLQKAAYAPLLFKCDIEGGEADLFSGDVGWVDAFPLLIVELHDWMLPGTANSRNFLRAIASFDMDFVYRGENVFCFNNRLLAAWASEPMTRVEELRQHAEQRPSAEAFLALSFACYEAKDFAACIAANHEALKCKPGFSQAYNNLGLALVELGRYAEAEQALETAVGLAPDFALARNNLTWVRSRIAAAPA